MAQAPENSFMLPADKEAERVYSNQFATSCPMQAIHFRAAQLHCPVTYIEPPAQKDTGKKSSVANDLAEKVTIFSKKRSIP
jgi:hypothetical protein